MYILNLIYKQPLTTSVMRGGGWMTAIINLAIIFPLSINNEGLTPLKIFILIVLLKENALTVT